MLTFDEFKKDILNVVEGCPKSWRYGQSVFNAIDCKYGVARSVQYEDGIDCFYNDESVDPFIQASYVKYCSSVGHAS